MFSTSKLNTCKLKQSDTTRYLGSTMSVFSQNYNCEGVGCDSPPLESNRLFLNDILLTTITTTSVVLYTTPCMASCSHCGCVALYFGQHRVDSWLLVQDILKPQRSKNLLGVARYFWKISSSFQRGAIIGIYLSLDNLPTWSSFWQFDINVNKSFIIPITKIF